MTARITSDGRRLLDELEQPVAALHTNQLRRLGEHELQTMRHLQTRHLLRTAADAGPVQTPSGQEHPAR